jgi:hypothetical protein
MKFLKKNVLDPAKPGTVHQKLKWNDYNSCTDKNIDVKCNFTITAHFLHPEEIRAPGARSLRHRTQSPENTL